MKIEPFKTRGLTEIYRMDLRFCGNGDTIGPKLPQVPRVGFCKMSRFSHCIFEEWNHFGWGRTCFFCAQIRDLQDGRKWTIYQPLSSFEQNIFKFSSGEVTQNFRGFFCEYKDGRFRLGPRMTRLHFQFQVWTPFIKSPDYFTAPCGSFAFISGVNLGTILLPIHRNAMKRLADSSIRSPRHFGVSLRRNHCRLGTQDGDGEPTKK